MGRIGIQNQTVFYILYSTSPSTFRLVCLLIFIFFRISFSQRRVTLAFPNVLECFPQTGMWKSLWFSEGRRPSFAITISTMNLKRFPLGVGVGRKLYRTFFLFIWHRLGNLLGISSTIEGVMHKRKTGFVPTTVGAMHMCPRLGR